MVVCIVCPATQAMSGCNVHCFLAREGAGSQLPRKLRAAPSKASLLAGSELLAVWPLPADWELRGVGLRFGAAERSVGFVNGSQVCARVLVAAKSDPLLTT